MKIEDYKENYVTGWVKMYRSFINWEWFDDSKMVHLFIFCIISANHNGAKWHGEDIKRGEFITSFNKISLATGMSIKSIRNALEKLEKTGEIIRKGTKNTKITICNYASYQQNEDKRGTVRAHEGHGRGTVGATNKNEKNEKNNIPTRIEFINYILSKKQNLNKEEIGFKYESWVLNGWCDGFNKPIKNWKSKALNQIPHFKQIEMSTKEQLIAAKLIRDENK